MVVWEFVLHGNEAESKRLWRFCPRETNRSCIFNAINAVIKAPDRPTDPDDPVRPQQQEQAGAGGRNRTGTGSPPTDFKSCTDTAKHLFFLHFSDIMHVNV